MLSLYSPAPSDSIDWSTGHYKLSTRGGRTESTARSGVLKKAVRMITEGSVVSGPSEPVGTAVNVAPDDFPHPVYRSGFALALKLPQQPQAEQGAVETPTDAEALEPQPCAPESQAAEPEHPEGVRESVYSEPEALGVSNSAQTEVSEPTIAEYGEAHEEAPSPAEPQSPDHEASHPEGKPAEPDLPPPDAPSQEPGNEL
jgi:hypothetical protein